MSKEFVVLSEIVKDCVESALNDMGDDIHDLSFFCSLEEASKEQEKAA